jgi:hypothetical protein
MAKTDRDFDPSLEATSDIESLFHPALAFDRPEDVVRDADLTLNEKRAILASWASDACAVESAPTLREAPGGARVTFEEIVDALRRLDAEVARMRMKTQGGARRRVNRWKYSARGGEGASGMGLH